MEQILNFFLSSAYADAASLSAQGQQASSFSFVIMFVVFFLFIYFGVWRPQNKRAKEARAMLDMLAKGDEVITAGGLLGRVTKISGPYLTLTVGTIDMVIQKSAVVTVLPKGTLKTIE